MSNPSNPRVFFDFSINNAPGRRVIFELFKDRVPITAENFRALCTGEKGYSTIAPETLLWYKGSPVHRIVPNFMIQGGDFIQQNGKSGESIYGGEFDDENFELDCDREGLLVMANKGPNTNQSQWFITLTPADHLTGKHVVFGRVQSGFEVVQEIGGLETDKKHRPLGGAEAVRIVHCGQLERKQKPPVEKTVDEPVKNRSDSELDRKRHSRSSSVASSASSRRSSSSSGSSESSGAARRRRRQEKKEKKKARKSQKSSKSKKLKFKEQPVEEHPPQADDPRAQEELALMKVELEHQQAERQRQSEEELARLEEEKARKARALELLKNKPHRKEGGVIFKGRGSMRYRDSDVTFGTRAWKD
ncbi:hypothetical protein PGT21_004192 [Puccinia graminis f. sp. tritici]|uniref:peptidylprolyl isomerase n=1 Tax=Puccinia graminis f. sp. tritici TaxID=56615 RepID=A0A5B0RP43_PUCGR|nr:hypothetical protein PGT21_004192 [Puccinia graminis f. sp. tritici]KAA1127600.1 hypothetical protein PGTUg99_003128 [Puccinia graminis f. sp. tritici]KAA1137139.1 hypothetical protein PGTUg99_000861 [Puccinia graminis f. sp. tritici]